MGRILTLVLLISVILRGGLVTTLPPELFGDEIDVGYQASSLLHTGRDLYGQPLPLYLHSLSEWRTPVLIYLTVPAIAIFGQTELGVRLPQVIFGSLTPLLIFLLAFRLTRHKWLSLLSGLVLVFMPWHILYSRMAYEVVVLILFLLLGTILMLKKKYLLSFFFFGLTPFTYSTAVIFTPLYFLGLLCLLRPRPQLVTWTLPVLMAAIFIFLIIFGPAAGRFTQINTLNDTEMATQISLSRKYDSSPLTKIFHNKYESSLRLVWANYLRGFSTEFLFVRGDPTFRQSLQIIGELLPITAPFLVFGIYLAIKSKYWLIFLWLLLAPLPASLTSDGGYHATRLFLLIPPLSILIGIGVYRFLALKPKIFIPLFSGLFIIYFAWVANYYLVLYPKLSWRWWQIGYRSTLTQLTRISSNYSRVFINNTYEPALIRFLFYTNYPPREFQKNFIIDQPENEIVPGYNGFTLDNKYFFGAFSEATRKNGLTKHLLPNALYLISQRDDVGGDWDWRKDPPSGVKVLYTSTNYLNEPILYLVTKNI